MLNLGSFGYCGLLTETSLSLSFNGACILLPYSHQPVYSGMKGNLGLWSQMSTSTLISALKFPTPPASYLLPMALMWLWDTHIRASGWPRQACRRGSTGTGPGGAGYRPDRWLVSWFLTFFPYLDCQSLRVCGGNHHLLCPGFLTVGPTHGFCPSPGTRALSWG